MKRNNSVRRGFTKADHIKYWMISAGRDWRAVVKMLEAKTYIHALFFMHLVLEKLIKAHWVKDNPENHPPRTHNLVNLCEQTKLEVTSEEHDFLRIMNDFQLESRYPEYTQKLYKMYKQKKTYAIFNSVNSMRKCLLKKLR